MEKVRLEDGMSRRASEELWQYENRYDSDNEVIFKILINSIMSLSINNTLIYFAKYEYEIEQAL